MAELPRILFGHERGNLSTVPTNLKVFLRGLLKMREKEILAKVIEIEKEI